jgi:hypothetical protein
MNIISYLMESRGPLNAMQRLPRIAGRFGLSSTKIERALGQFVSITERYSCTPTLTVTSVVLDRNASFFQELQNHAELAVHGYVHTDYSLLSETEQLEHMERALALFHKAGIYPEGFRCPYFRWNTDSIKVAAKTGFKYGSNGVISWDVVNANSVGNQAWLAYDKGLQLYNAVESSKRLNLPYVYEDILLDIPTSLPDDEAIIDRLQLGNTVEKDRIWPEMLDIIYANGELFTLSLHNERVPLCAGGLEAVLSRARVMTPSVWIAPMRDIADWWNRRSTWRLEVRRCDDETYELSYPTGEGSLTLIGRGLEPETRQAAWYGDYSRLEVGITRVKADRPPVIEVEEDCSPELVRFLVEEGFAVTREAGTGALLIKGYEVFSERDKRPVLEFIERSRAPLVRIWRWPDGARSALTITGDIDSMTLIDFFRRPFEV